MLDGLTTTLLNQACRIFLGQAYPGGPDTIPPAKRAFGELPADQPIEAFLKPPVCQPIPAPGGGTRGYAFRLGSAHYPHLKLLVQTCGGDPRCVFTVDTHDVLRLAPNDPDAAGWAALQITNRLLKEAIEQAWDAEGLLTFNGLLRRDMGVV